MKVVAMKVLLVSMAMSGLLVVGQQALALNPMSPVGVSKRQTIKDCMSKQMAADKTMSYNLASKTCNERVKAQRDNVQSRLGAKQSSAGAKQLSGP